MGLDIFSSDDKKNFHIGYIGFTNMRGYFILSSHGEKLYNDYEKIVRHYTDFEVQLGRSNKKCPVDEELFDKSMGDLNILIDHSDADGELTSDECQKLLPCLMVDEDKLKSTRHYENNPEYIEHMIKQMHSFIDLIQYCASNPDIKLIFG